MKGPKGPFILFGDNDVYLLIQGKFDTLFDFVIGMQYKPGLNLLSELATSYSTITKNAILQINTS